MGANVFDEDRNDNGKSPKGTTILVLVIVGIVFLPCAVIALVMSAIELKRGYRNDSKVMAAFIISLIIVIVQIISITVGLYALSVSTHMLKNYYYNMPTNGNRYSSVFVRQI